MKFLNRLSVKPLAVMCIVMAGLTGCDQVGSMQQKIVYVDVIKVLAESPVGKQEAERNQQVKDLLLQTEKNAQAAYKNMSTEQRQKSREADATIINRLWAAEQDRARSESMTAIAKAVEAYRSANKLDLVLSSTQLVAADVKSDITQNIIKQLQEVKVAYGELPQISIKEIAAKAAKVELKKPDQADTKISDKVDTKKANKVESKK